MRAGFSSWFSFGHSAVALLTLLLRVLFYIHCYQLLRLERVVFGCLASRILVLGRPSLA